MFCYDHGHPGGDEGVGHASEPAELVNQIEALQSQINKMRPALEALQAEYDVAKEAHPDGVEVPPAPAPTVNKKSPKKKPNFFGKQSRKVMAAPKKRSNAS